MAERPDETRRLIAKYKSDLANLEEMEEDMARRIQIMENMIPTVLVWFMWKSSQEKKRLPFPQGETEEEAQRKLAHLETVLEELQEAELILKEEEKILRKRIEELEQYFSKEYVDPYLYEKSLRTSDDLEIDKEITDGFEKIRDLENKKTKYTDLLGDSNTDWQETCKELCEQVDNLTVTLKKTNENLKASEEQVKKLETSFLQTDEKDIEGKEKPDKTVNKGKKIEVDREDKTGLSFVENENKEMKSIKEELITVKTEQNLKDGAKEQNQEQVEKLTTVKVEKEYNSEIMTKDDDTGTFDEQAELDRVTAIDVTESVREKMQGEDEIEMLGGKEDVPMKDEKEIIKLEAVPDSIKTQEKVLDQVVSKTEIINADVLDTVEDKSGVTEVEAILSTKETFPKMEILPADDTVQIEDAILVKNDLPAEDVPLVKDVPLLEDAPLAKNTLLEDDVPLSKDNLAAEDPPLEKDDIPEEDTTLAIDTLQMQDTPLADDSLLANDAFQAEATRAGSSIATPDIEKVLERTAADSMEAQAITSEPFEVPYTDGIPERTPSGLDFEKEGERLKARPSADSLKTQTLQSKCRVKDHLIKSMADQLRDLARNNVWSGSRLLENMSEDPVNTYDFDRTTLFKYLKGEEPQNFAASMQPNDSYTAANPLNVKILRKLDKDSLLIEWGPPPSPQIVGFQIFINGEFMYWVHSAKRNKALLHPLDLSDQLDITVSPVDAEGNIVFKSSLKYTSQ